MNKTRKSSKPSLPIGAACLARAQARALARNANSLGRAITKPLDAGRALAYLVNAGLAIELYLKAFMLVARNGNVSEGHDLSKLLAEFPPFLRKAFNDAYEAHPTARSADIQLIALKLSASAPEKPESGGFIENYVTFDQAIDSIAHIFIKARYFFETLKSPDWAIFSVPTHAITGVLHALENTYHVFESGGFKDEGL